jgi:hypothetical protein
MVGPYSLRRRAGDVDVEAHESLFTGIDLPRLGYRCAQRVATPNATHVVLTKA